MELLLSFEKKKDIYSLETWIHFEIFANEVK